ncbi:glycoside hydrolase [Biscogniauxia sp. FL1348]|nr:glycoside hydrolase [Biscogniauxia sp. FL1348]
MQLSLSLLLMAATSHAHYHFDRVIVNGTPEPEPEPWTAPGPGELLGFVANAAVTPLRPRVPAGDVWFKAASISAAVPSGKYLVRVESIALHQAQSVGGAQIYLSCAQVEVLGGGSGTPARTRCPTPDCCGRTTPVPTSYAAPGPEVWVG